MTTHADKELTKIAKSLEKIAKAQQPRGGRQIMEEYRQKRTEEEAHHRADWALRFAALTSVAALLTAIATLVIAL